MYDLSEDPEKKDKPVDRTHELRGLLRTKTIDLYTQILKYQISLGKHYSHNQFYRLLRDIAVPDEWNDLGKNIKETESNIDSTLKILDYNSSQVIDRQLSILSDEMKEVATEVKVSWLAVICLLALIMFAESVSIRAHNDPSKGMLRSF
jgi:N-terminal domain of NWD NACHT-NTPase